MTNGSYTVDDIIECLMDDAIFASKYRNSYQRDAGIREEIKATSRAIINRMKQSNTLLYERDGIDFHSTQLQFMKELGTFDANEVFAYEAELVGRSIDDVPPLTVFFEDNKISDLMYGGCFSNSRTGRVAITPYGYLTTKKWICDQAGLDFILHECGHLCTARTLGQKVADIPGIRVIVDEHTTFVGEYQLPFKVNGFLLISAAKEAFVYALEEKGVDRFTNMNGIEVVRKRIKWSKARESNIQRQKRTSFLMRSCLGRVVQRCTRR